VYRRLVWRQNNLTVPPPVYQFKKRTVPDHVILAILDGFLEKKILNHHSVNISHSSGNGIKTQHYQTNSSGDF